MPGKILFSLARAVRSLGLEPELDIVHLDVQIPNMPVELEGFTIAQISDLHSAGQGWEPMRASEAARALREAGPDVVVNTGDFILGTPPLSVTLEAARPFVLESKVGDDGPVNLAVFGNHDYYAGTEAIDELRDGLQGLGVRVLLNESVCVRHRRGGVSLVGLNEQEPGFQEAIEALAEYESPRIILVHEPDVAERLSNGIADLILCGHTHGGQITLPLLTPAIVKRFSKSRYTKGQYAVNGNRLYINRGMGCSGLPFRFGASPELTFLHLVR